MSKITAAQSELATQLAALQHMAGNSALTEELRSQLQVLQGLSQFLSTAHGAALYQLRAEVATSVAASRSISQQAQGVVTAAQAGQAADHMAELATARDDARRTTENFLHDVYEKHIFDPYLHFDTPEDERAYRERETQRRHDIEDAKTKDTPQGDLRAANLVVAQLDDAKAHGADKSPDFNGIYGRATASRDALAKAVSGVADDTRDVAMASPTSPTSPVSPELLATLKNSGLTLADQAQEGHGVSVNASLASALARA